MNLGKTLSFRSSKKKADKEKGKGEMDVIDFLTKFHHYPLVYRCVMTLRVVNTAVTRTEWYWAGLSGLFQPIWSIKM